MGPQDQETSDAQQNIPSMALMFTAFSPTFGAYTSVVNAPQRGQLADQFPSIPYQSIEAMFYVLGSSNPTVAPANITTGASSGSQTLQGTQLQQDGVGVPRSLTGYQSSNQTTL